jgi:CHASE2 domain-containing sensor protein
MIEEPQAPDARRIIRWVVLAILAWGVFHAVGAWRLNHNPLRAVVVLGCVAGFLGFWMAMLAARQRRLSKAEVSDVDRPGREPR